jgi:hypothetical protein
MEDNMPMWRKFVFAICFILALVAGFYAVVWSYGGARWLYIEQTKDFNNSLVSSYLLIRGLLAAIVSIVLFAAGFLALGRRSSSNG